MDFSGVFKKANTLFKEREKLFQEKEVHVISFEWNKFTPILKAFDGEKIEEIDLGKIDFNVSQGKICVGSFEDGYTPCPESRTVKRFNQCRRCKPDSIPKLECIFDPSSCEGCEGGFCEEEHAVYLAFVSRHPKIGMTMKSRLKKRMIEQGVDAYALLATLDHRKKAREEEKELSQKLNISQRISSKKKLKSMAKKVDKTSIRTKYTGVKNRVAIGKLNFLNDYPITLPLRAAPRLRPVPGMHRGEMVGVKGGFLIYENNGLQALKLSDLPGRKIKIRES